MQKKVNELRNTPDSCKEKLTNIRMDQFFVRGISGFSEFREFFASGK